MFEETLKLMAENDKAELELIATLKKINADLKAANDNLSECLKLVTEG